MPFKLQLGVHESIFFHREKHLVNRMYTVDELVDFLARF